MARYTPGVVPMDAKAVPGFLGPELAKIAQAKDTADEFLQLKELNKAPTKIRDGMVVLADGVNWDPSAGQGAYVYYAAAWHKLG